MIACKHTKMEISYHQLLEEYYALKVPELGLFLKEKNGVICGGSILYANKPWEVDLDVYESDLNIIYQTIPSDSDNSFDWTLHLNGVQEYTICIHSDPPVVPSLKSSITFQKINAMGRTVRITVMEILCTWKQFIEGADMSIHQNYATYEESSGKFEIYTYHPNLLMYRLFKKMYESDWQSQNDRIQKYCQYGYHYFVEYFSQEGEENRE